MNRVLVLGLAVGLVACGGKTAKDFSGSYAGTEVLVGTATTTLEDGTTASLDLSRSEEGTQTLAAPDEVTLTLGSGASMLTFKQDSANDLKFTMTPLTVRSTDPAGLNSEFAITAGSLEFDGTSVTLTRQGTFTKEVLKDDLVYTFVGPLSTSFTGTKK